MKIGEIIDCNGHLCKVTKQVDEYSYEICDMESGALSLFVIGRPMLNEENI